MSFHVDASAIDIDLFPATILKCFVVLCGAQSDKSIGYGSGVDVGLFEFVGVRTENLGLNMFTIKFLFEKKSEEIFLC